MTTGAAAHVTPAVYPGVEPSSGTRSDVRSLLRQLTASCVAPIEHLLPDGTDGLRHHPARTTLSRFFATLLDDDDGYLNRTAHARVHPSIIVLPYTARNLARVNTTAPRVFVVGNPMTAHTGPGVRSSECLTITAPAATGRRARSAGCCRSLSPDLGHRLSAQTHRSRRLRALAPVQSIIHLATHAVVSDERPMESYLALAATNGDISNAVASTHDGFLTVAEIFGLNLRAGLCDAFRLQHWSRPRRWRRRRRTLARVHLRRRGQCSREPVASRGYGDRDADGHVLSPPDAA